MKQTANTLTYGGLVGAVALAGASQAYGTIVSVTPPTNIAGVAANTAASTKEFWDIDTGTTSATKTAASDIEFGYLNSSTYNESFTGIYVLNTGKSLAYYASNGTHYAYGLAQGAKIGTGSAYTFTQSTTSFTIMSLTYAGTAYAIQKPNYVEYVGFDFKAADGLIHDGWIELESVSSDGTVIDGGLKFIAAAYNSVPEASGGYINAGLLTGGSAVPEPGTLSALALGAAGLAGVGLKRRRRAALAAAQD